MRNLPSFFSLRAFEAAARQGSFTRAGEELHLTTSAISHQVRALEEWFGKPLFVRRTRQVGLTLEGELLLEKLAPAFDLIEDACAMLKPSRDRRALAVHCAPSFVSKWLGPRLARFMRDHPNITLELSSSAEPSDLRREEALDIDIAYGVPPHRDGIVVEPLGQERTVPMCAPRLLTEHPVKRPRDVLGMTLLESKLNPVRWKDWCELHGLKLPAGRKPSFDRGALVISAAVDGLGVALETTRFAEAELARGELVVLDRDGFRAIDREMHFLCYRRHDAADAQVAGFRQWLLAQVRGGA